MLHNFFTKILKKYDINKKTSGWRQSKTVTHTISGMGVNLHFLSKEQRIRAIES